MRVTLILALAGASFAQTHSIRLADLSWKEAADVLKPGPVGPMVDGVLTLRSPGDAYRRWEDSQWSPTRSI